MDTIKDKYDNVFEIVDAVPEGFKVWNISKIDEAGEYLPLYEPLHPGTKTITASTPTRSKRSNCPPR